jgi:hypothetical protein
MKFISTKKISKSYMILLSLPLCMFLLSNSGGRASQASEGNTGSPGDTDTFNKTCLSCHGSNIQLTNTIMVTDANGSAVTSYSPGETYSVTVTLSSTGNPSSYGFQLVSELGNMETINGFANPSSNAKLVTVGGSRQYVEQNGPSASNEFTVEWTAPADDQGTITFYSAGIGANGNSMSSGDGGATANFALTPSTTSNNEVSTTAVNVYPNPSSDFIQIDSEEIKNLQIFASNGQLMQSNKELSGNEINISNLDNGLYFIQFEADNKFFTSKFVKN